jgi:hypothetical protein
MVGREWRVDETSQAVLLDARYARVVGEQAGGLGRATEGETTDDRVVDVPGAAPVLPREDRRRTRCGDARL